MAAREDEDGGVPLDLRGLKCPLPAIRTGRAVSRLAAGARLTVFATDPLSPIDVPHAVAQAGGRLLAQERDGDVFIFRIVRE
jgi:tRNA 2-thiouridine synthesizing protein A